jgi:hypothetical protein
MRAGAIVAPTKRRRRGAGRKGERLGRGLINARPFARTLWNIEAPETGLTQL